jgi:membrane associated rhomboid family serine protease
MKRYTRLHRLPDLFKSLLIKSMTMQKGFFFPIGTSLKPLRFAFLTKALVLVNIAVFVWSISGDFEQIIYDFGFIPASFSSLTLITSMFLHGDFWHIFGNMIYLWIFGDNIEDYFGKLLFLPIYLLWGVIASVTHLISASTSLIPAVGASGAIAGVLGAYVVLYPDTNISVLTRFGIQKISARIMIGLWFIFQLFYAFYSLTGPEAGIAFFAHVGGFVGGYTLAKIAIRKKKPRRPLKRQQYYRVYSY